MRTGLLIACCDLGLTSVICQTIHRENGGGNSQSGCLHTGLKLHLFSSTNALESIRICACACASIRSQIEFGEDFNAITGEEVSLGVLDLSRV